MNARRNASPEAHSREYRVDDRIKVRLTGGRLVDAEIRAIVETSEGKRLQVSFGEETAQEREVPYAHKKQKHG